MTAMRTIISTHNRKVSASPWGGYNIKIVPPETRLRGIELDDFINVDEQLSPETLVENYINENLSSGNYDFIGNNILTSLVWDKFKNNRNLKNILIEKFAVSFHSQASTYGTKYESIRDNFKTITGLDPSLLDVKIQFFSKKSNNP
jgi:hypothetical protein